MSLVRVAQHSFDQLALRWRQRRLRRHGIANVMALDRKSRVDAGNEVEAREGFVEGRRLLAKTYKSELLLPQQPLGADHPITTTVLAKMAKRTPLPGSRIWRTEVKQQWIRSPFSLRS